MSLKTKLVVGLLSFGVLTAGALPGMSRPAKLTTRTNLRSEPSLTSSVLEVLAPGPVEVLKVVEGKDGSYWYYVRSAVEGTEDGWISSDLARFEPSDRRYATLKGTSGDKINVRSAPNLNSNIRHYGLPGDLVTVENSRKDAAGNRWYRVKFPSNAIGWVREDLLSIWPKGCIITCPDD